MPTATATTAGRRDRVPPEKPNLERRYGAIGIPAVAAAARYQGAARNPMHAPAAASKATTRHEDAARRSDGAA